MSTPLNQILEAEERLTAEQRAVWAKIVPLIEPSDWGILVTLMGFVQRDWPFEKIQRYIPKPARTPRSGRMAAAGDEP